MDQTERQVIDDLFAKLRQAEDQAGARDAQAEQHIISLLRSQPQAPYYMAQAIVVQEHAVKAAQARIEQLERELSTRPAAGGAAGGGFLGGLFGGGPAGGQRGQVPPPPPNPQLQSLQRYGQRGPWGGGGGGSSFLGGAMQTAMGVAGGLVLGNLLMSAFDGGGAMAADAVQDLGQEVLPEESLAATGEAAYADEGDTGDFGGDEI